jgi:poly(3-hydroxybutyrate) depolymerase
MFRVCLICGRFALLSGLVLALWGVASVGRSVGAAEIRLKNGTVLDGQIEKLDSLIIGPKKPKEGNVPYYPIYVVTSPLKRYFVPRSQEDVLNAEAELGRPEGFKLEQLKARNSGGIIGAVQGYPEKPGPFNEYGRRTVILESAKGDLEVIQAMTVITPEWTKLMAVNFTWETAIATSSIPIKQLDPILRKITNANNPDHRQKIAVFYIQARKFEEAQRELEAIGKEFPELAARVEISRKQLHVYKAKVALNELKLRRRAGQHDLAYIHAKEFPAESVDNATLREAREIQAEYEQKLERGEMIKADLAKLQGLLKTDPRVKEIAPIRAEIVENLNYINLDRLDAYFKLSGDALLKPDEKLALAFSGWVVGSSNAVTVLNDALAFWQARFLLIDYLRTAPEAAVERTTLLTRLKALEGVGPDRIAQILPLLPASGDTSGLSAGQAVRISVPGEEAGEENAYWVTLPFEYHADHSYPLIVALHSEQGGPQQELQGFWGGTEDRTGQSQRHGYVVIAPEYIPKANAAKGYDYSEASHQIVIASLRDALRRFNIDADRVFLSGHGMGGDAAWDMGLSHPFLFAGVIPINGAIDRYSVYYLENGKPLPFYSVVGEKDTNLFERNATHLMKIFMNGTDLMHAEYRGAGPDTFYSEIHALFDWMSRLRRDPIPRKIDVRTLREGDSHFSWFEFSGIPENMKGIDWSNRQRAVHALIVSAKITQANSILVTSRAARHRLWIPRDDGLIDFNKRLEVRINGKQVWNDFVKPDLEALLERVRTTGDRQQLFWAVLEFPIGK